MTEARSDNGNKTVVTSPDPTTNVRELVEAAILRLDDLRQAEGRRQDDLRLADSRRITEVTDAARVHTCEIMKLRAEHATELNAAETKRIDAIRAVDVAAVAIATERAAAAATVLANQVSTSAETLRALVATTASASAQQSTASFGQLADRITLLERTSYESGGKSSVSDPQIAQLIVEMREARTIRDKGEGKSAGVGLLAGAIGTAILVGAAVIGLILRWSGV